MVLLQGAAFDHEHCQSLLHLFQRQLGKRDPVRCRNAAEFDDAGEAAAAAVAEDDHHDDAHNRGTSAGTTDAMVEMALLELAPHDLHHLGEDEARDYVRSDGAHCRS